MKMGAEVGGSHLVAFCRLEDGGEITCWRYGIGEIG